MHIFELLADQTPSMVRTAAKSDDGGLAVAAAQAFVELLQLSPPLPPHLFERHLLPTALAALNSAALVPAEESEVGAEWLYFVVLLLRTGQLPPPTIERLVLPWALSKGEVSRRTHARARGLNTATATSSHFIALPPRPTHTPGPIRSSVRASPTPRALAVAIPLLCRSPSPSAAGCCARTSSAPWQRAPPTQFGSRTSFWGRQWVCARTRS